MLELKNLLILKADHANLLINYSASVNLETVNRNIFTSHTNFKHFNVGLIKHIVTKMELGLLKCRTKPPKIKTMDLLTYI